MKKLLLLLAIFSTLNLLADELSWVDEQVEAIKPPREGISPQEVSKLKDPFIYYAVDKKKKHVKHIFHTHHKKGKKKVVVYNAKLSLAVIMNKSAFINGKWYKEGEKISGYTITHVNPGAKSVLLTKGKKQKILTTMSKNRNLKFK